MTHLAHNDGKRALLSLAECGAHILAIRGLLVDTLSPYTNAADCGLASILEVFSGIATEFSKMASDTGENEPQIRWIDEPSSFDEAIKLLPTFFADVVKVLRSSAEIDALSACEMSVRSQTFAFFLRGADVADMDHNARRE